MSRLVDLFVGLALLAVVGRVLGQSGPNCTARNATQVYDSFSNPNPTFVNPKNSVTGATCYLSQQKYSVTLPAFLATTSTQLQGFGVNLHSITNGRVEFFDSDGVSILNTSAPFNSGAEALSAGSLYFTLFETDPNNPATLVLTATLVTLPSATTTTTSIPTTTTSYNGPANVNPGLLSLDLAIGFDTAIGAGTGGQPALDTAIGYSRAFVNQLSLTTDLTAGLNSSSGSRLFPFTLSLTDNLGLVGFPFQYDSARFNGFTDSVFNTDPSVTNSYYVRTLNSVLSNFDASKKGPTRPTAQRVVILLSTNTPSERTSFGSVLNPSGPAANDDVHVIVVSFNNKTWPDNVASNVTSPFLQQLVYDYSATPFDNTIALLNLLTNGDSLCQQPLAKDGVITSPNFNFGSSGLPTTGQNGRYCNFQYQQFNVTAPSKSCISFTMNYELEKDVDFLYFWDSNGNRIASFTGLDVNNGKLVVDNSPWVRISFTTNEKTVLGGFQISYGTCQ